ncbi:MAG: hypothetical protein IPJ33_19475 [Gammaproteobacteria bacterium]|nr:hypothetical protein [Gammaproteobacteria bacterium]
MPSSAAAQSDEEILELYRKGGQPGFHATGTCAMGRDGVTSVVDGNTRVHGIDGVRVVDCSIYPEMLAGITNASIRLLPCVLLTGFSKSILRSILEFR